MTRRSPVSSHVSHLSLVVKIIAALKADLRSTDLIASAEVDSSMKEAKTAIDNLHTWMKPEEKSVPLVHKPGSGCIVKEPYGLVLIISPVPLPPCFMPPRIRTPTPTRVCTHVWRV
jgi:hypothetical protein